ncbi:MAG: efflux RND transporter periplasmic adaptor subunit [Acidiferrobacter sp.]
MRRLWGVVSVVLVIAVVWFFVELGANRARSPAVVATATVSVATIQTAPIVNHLVAYGRVVAAPWAVHALVEPFEVSVTRVFVNRGQSVGKGATLLVLSPGPTARLALRQAQNNLRLAKMALKEERMRVRLRLATRLSLLRAQKIFDDARLRMQIFHEEGLQNRMVVAAPVGGVVRRILVEEGSTVKPGRPLADIVAGDRLEVRLGVEPENVPATRVGESVRLSSFDGASQANVHGLVAVISRVMDPATHMINVFVTLPVANPYLLGEYVEGRFTVVSPRGLVVARSAVVPVGHHYVLYTVAKGRAVAHRVLVGAHNGRVVQVINRGLHAGMQVVVLGNYELKPDMPVRVGR